MNEFHTEPIHFSIDTVLYNRIIRDKSIDVKNLICLMAKQYIYRQRCLGRQIEPREFKFIVYDNRNMEKFIAMKNNKLNKHMRKWYPNTATEIENVIQENSVDNYIKQYIDQH